MTSPRTTDRPRPMGPERFQQDAAADDRASVAAAMGSALALVLIVIGVPALLLWLDGPPSLPTSWPTLADLTATIGVEQVLTVLVVVVWLAWLQFTVCVVVELRSALSGVGLPRRVPLAGPSQRLARTLVGSVLVLVTAIGPATAVTHPGESPAPAVTTVSQAAEEAPVVEEAPAEAASDADVTYWLGDLQLTAEEGQALVGQRVYVVQPPEGRYHDNMWDIAERTLGEGRRYQEIFDLNQGRTQPDGQELSLARLIHPGWLLAVPEDATDVPRVTARAVTPVVEDAPVIDGDAAGADGAVAGSASAGYDGADAAGETGTTTRELVGTGLLAAGLLALIEALRRRRRTAEPDDAAVEVEVALRVGATPARVALLDSGLRHLGAARADAGRDLPGVYAAVVSDDRLTVHLAPADPAPPTPWRAEEDGVRWVLDAPVAAGGSRPAPFPGLVSVGQDFTGADVLIDLEAAQGPVAVVGDPVAARQVVTALAAELATNRWSDAIAVGGLGLPEELAGLPGDRYRPVTDLAAVLTRFRARTADPLGTGVLTGRHRGPRGGERAEYLVLGHLPPDPADLVTAATSDHRAPLGVVCAGELPGARWRLQVDAAGSLDLGPLGLQVRANRLGEAELTAFTTLLQEAPERPVVVAAEHEPLAERPRIEPGREVTAADLATAPVRVVVLGRPRVESRLPVDPDRVPLLTELVVHLALHPEGVHPAVLGSALWPRGVTPAVRDATVARARQWLGADAAGSPHLREDLEGRLHLGPGVVLDWHVVRTGLTRARSAPPAAERALLTEALRLVGGPVLAGRPGGRYSWLARVRLEREVVDLVVDAAHRLVQLCRDDDDPDGARAAAEAGLRVAPTEELLWRDLLRARSVHGAEAVLETAAELERALHGVGTGAMAPATTALLAELVPAAGLDGTGLPATGPA